MKLFDATLTHLSHALDTRLERQNLLAGNIANADTPNYAPRELDFAAAMRQANDAEAGSDTPAEAGHISLESIHPRAHLSHETGTAGASATMDGNTVDLDKTLVAVAENALQYGASARAAGKKLAILRYVASDGNA